MHLPDQSEAPRPKQPRVSTRELILRASEAIAAAKALARETAAYCEESRFLRERVRARRKWWALPWR
jgi:hypothetical protein